MNDIVFFIIQHPRDAIAVLSMLLVVYLVNAIKNRIEKDFAEMRATQLEHGKLLTEIRIALAQGATYHEEVVEVRHEIREVKHRLERWEDAHGV